MVSDAISCLGPITGKLNIIPTQSQHNNLLQASLFRLQQELREKRSQIYLT